MSDLVVIGYDDMFKADEVLLTLARLQKEHLIDLEDACVVVRDEKGKIKLKQAHNLTAAGAMGGGMWGMLIGLIFLHPLLGLVAGGAAGALSGSMSDIGIDDEFIKELGATLDKGTSALFILVRQSTPDKVVPEIKPFGGKVLQTSLSIEDETKLKEMLEGAATP